MGDHEERGGDAACWLAQVCPECGAFLEDRTAPCWRCGTAPGAAPDRTTEADEN